MKGRSSKNSPHRYYFLIFIVIYVIQRQFCFTFLSTTISNSTQLDLLIINPNSPTHVTNPYDLDGIPIHHSQNVAHGCNQSHKPSFLPKTQ